MESVVWFIRYIMAFVKKLGRDSVSAYAAQAAFFIILSLFPFAMLLISILQLLRFPAVGGGWQGWGLEFLPQAVTSFLASVFGEIYAKTTSAAIISISAITALWSAGKGIHAMIRGLNAVYESPESRNYFKLRFTSALYTLIFILIIVITLGLWAFGNSLREWVVETVPAYKDFAILVISFRTAVGLCVLVAFFLAIYKILPNRKSTFLHELPGAILCSCGWIGFSLLYSFYIDNFANYANVYGSLTAIVLLMLWLYFCMYIMFFGAEVNILYQSSPWMRRLDLKLARRRAAKRAARKAKKNKTTTTTGTTA